MGVHPFAQMPVVMDRYARSLEGAVEEAVKLIVWPGFVTIVDTTRVDTALAVSNWVVRNGQPFTGVRSPRAPSSKGSGGGAARNAVLAEGHTTVELFRLSTPLYITNNVPYIGKLERGGRNVPPGNMVARGVQNMVRTAKGIRILKMAEAKV